MLVSNSHDKAEIDGKSVKPEVILDYNLTKGGVDTYDKVFAAYSVPLIARRWSLVIFCTIINIAVINSRALFLLNKVHEESGRTLLRELSKSLIKENLISRA